MLLRRCARKFRHLRRDEGQVLVVVLLFMIVFSLILAALLTNASANLANTVGVRTQEKAVYAADSGIDWGLQTLRNTNTICVDPTTAPLGTPQVIGTPSFNGQTTTVTCEVLSGSASGANGWAVITTDPDPQSFRTPPPASDNFTKTINGPVFAAGFDDSNLRHVLVTNGDVYERQSAQTCSTDADKPSDVTVQPSPPYFYHCTSLTNPGTVVPHALPDITTLANRGPDPDPGLSTPSCNVFLPGKYTSLNLANNNRYYFVSGIYYFVNVQIEVSHQIEVVGGAKHIPAPPALPEESQLTPCASDPVGTAGIGVKFLLGGTSSIDVTNPGGQMELFGRDNGDPTVEGTQDIAIQTVPSSAPNPWVPSSLTPTDLVLNVSSGNTPFAAIHGLVYTPNAGISFDATNNARAWMLGGVVTGRLALSQQATIEGVRVSVDLAHEPRQMILTSTVSPAGGHQTVSKAILTVTNSTPPSVSIQSWRTECKLATSASQCVNT